MEIPKTIQMYTVEDPSHLPPVNTFKVKPMVE